MKKINSLVAFGFLFVLFQCKTAKETGEAKPSKVYVPSEAQMDIANKRWANTSADELKEGQIIYTSKCNECHKTFDVTRFSEKKWVHELDVMSPKAQLSVDEKTKLTKYILSMRVASAKPAKG